ncbi:MAG: helix-turn-helix domain-containing protein [Bacteroidales bacterium]
METKFFNELMAEMQELKKLMLLRGKDTLTLSEAALHLGLSKSHLYKLCMNRAVPFYKGAGGKFSYFDKSELDKWAKSHKVATAAEIEQEAAAYLVTGKKKGK